MNILTDEIADNVNEFICQRLEDANFGEDVPAIKQARGDYSKEFNKIHEMVGFNNIKDLESNEVHLRNRQMEFAYLLGLFDAMKIRNK
jgi:hypothetical protein